ncbi:MAG: acetyl-CoA decarbonylase/synthase complex subunit gamma [Clostridia bacterium]|nr:MAG: acetyl-CoA decarbonylase/synthase complex subunit gamma [Clostridia bacterium]
MALTGLEIYKQLPKKNCGECGPPTCLAFAMALAGGKASLDSCPYVSDAARAALDSAAAPPIAKVVVGSGDTVIELGDETELFRHDKKFYHETAVAFLVSDTLGEAELSDKVAEINQLAFHRVGLEYRIQMVAIKNDSGNPETFKNAVQTVASNTGLALALISENPEAISQALGPVASRKPLVSAATEANWEQMVAAVKDSGCALAVKAAGLDNLAALVEKITGAGYKQLVLDPMPDSVSRAVADFTQIRRLAIKKKFRPFGYPLIAFTQAEDPLEEVTEAAAYVAKYASVVVLKTTDRAALLPLLTLRQNIYTDPQVPIQVEEGIHEVGTPNENSPVYVTTNFSLTYYSVEGEVEGSRIPSHIISVNTDGLSVMTSYADGKFEAEKIAETMKKYGIEAKVKHRNIVIPGGVAVIKGKLEELTGWKVIVGPREASGIAAFAKSQFA